MRYYFHIRDSQGLIPDEEGSLLPDIAAARREARASARDFAMDDLRGGRQVTERIIEIAGEDGAVVERLPVRDAMNQSSL